MSILGEMNDVASDLAQLVRLALAEQTGDVRLFVARLVRKYRATEPELAEQLDLYLRTNTPRSSAPLRRAAPPAPPTQALPVDDESRLSLLKVFKDTPDREAPLLSRDLEESLLQLIEERRQSKRLAASGLTPTRSANFVGKPGVGKTLTARWLAANNPHHPHITVVGSGRITRRRVDFLKAEGIVVDAWADIDRRKAGRILDGAPVIHHDDLPPGAFVVPFVASIGAADHIRAMLERRGFARGRSFIEAA